MTTEFCHTCQEPFSLIKASVIEWCIEGSTGVIYGLQREMA